MVKISLNEGIGDLHSAIEIARDYLDSSVIDSATTVLERATKRRATGEDATVVALAGATGAGKSSLVNALVGQTVARVAATRPTTAEPLALFNTQVTKTLDWLEIAQRQHLPQLSERIGAHGSIVLVDLPDIDSTVAANRTIAARLTGLVDVVIWVLDPQKYADAVLHEDYLENFGEHSATMLTVLNQVDRIAPADRAAVIANLSEIISAHGLSTHILPVSATTGEGVDELRAVIADVVARQTAATEKLAADVRTQGALMLGNTRSLGGSDPSQAKDPSVESVERALGRAAGCDAVARAAGDSYLYRGKSYTGWPLTKWIGKAKIDPLKRLRLLPADSKPEPIESETHVAPVSSLVVSETAQTAARVALRDYAVKATEHMPDAWAMDAQQHMATRAATFLTRAEAVIMSTDIEAGRVPLWWRLVKLLQWLAFLTLLVGFGWLLLRQFGTMIGIKLPEPPYYGIVSLPLILLVGGLLVGWMLTLISRVALRKGAERTVRRVSARLSQAVAREAKTHVLAGLESEIERYADFIELAKRMTQVQS